MIVTIKIELKLNFYVNKQMKHQANKNDYHDKNKHLKAILLSVAKHTSAEPSF